MIEEKRPLTGEERRIASAWLDGMDEYLIDSDAEVQEKWREYKARYLADNTPGEIEALMDIFKSGHGFGDLGFLMGFDMWYNRSPIWPVPLEFVEARNKERNREEA